MQPLSLPVAHIADHKKLGRGCHHEPLLGVVSDQAEPFKLSKELLPAREPSGLQLGPGQLACHRGGRKTKAKVGGKTSQPFHGYPVRQPRHERQKQTHRQVWPTLMTGPSPLGQPYLGSTPQRRPCCGCSAPPCSSQSTRRSKPQTESGKHRSVSLA